MFNDFLKITETYKLKEVSRSCSNFYDCEKENVRHERKETTAEHVYSCLKLADYFLSTEKEFSKLDRLKVYELLMYHDDIEIDTEEISISEREKRENKEALEKAALPILASKYPEKLKEKLIIMDSEFREERTLESKFAHSVDKMDALVHELKYPEDWGPKGFGEKNVRDWFQPAFEHSSTFSEYFENIITYLKENGHFNI
jgi:putative hydrolase of HD superfamily